MRFNISTVHEAREFLVPLFEKHWEEVCQYKDTFKLNPDWDTYYALEKLGLLVSIVAENDTNEIVGYSVFILQPHQHYKDQLVAKNDILYLLPEYRVGRNALRLIQYSEKILKEMEVSFVTMHSKVKQDFGRLLSLLKYDAHEIIYAKELR